MKVAHYRKPASHLFCEGHALQCLFSKTAPWGGRLKTSRWSSGDSYEQ